jgi:predicted secreted protein
LKEPQASKKKTDIGYKETFMARRKSILFILILLLSGIFSIWAGDTATFVDLGFSPDGRVYMFAQYGIQAKTLRPWADLFAVDVNRNSFISGGTVSYVHDTAAVSGQDGAGAFYRLLSRNTALADQAGVNFLVQGHLLYVALDEDMLAPPGRTVEFRDFNNGTSYKARLVTQTEGSGNNLKSSFYIDFEQNSRNGTRKSYVAGTPHVKRPLVAEYRICKVILAPRNNSIVFVIEQKKQGESGFDTRYMIETLPL